MGKHFIDPKSSVIQSIFQVFSCMSIKLPFFGQLCSLPFSLRSFDIPALLKSMVVVRIEMQAMYSAVGEVCAERNRRVFGMLEGFIDLHKSAKDTISAIDNFHVYEIAVIFIITHFVLSGRVNRTY
jgi:hypothetical protein